MKFLDKITGWATLFVMFIILSGIQLFSVIKYNHFDSDVTTQFYIVAVGLIVVTEVQNLTRRIK